MKKYPFLLLACIVSSPLIAQIENTKWKSTVTINGPENVLFHFKKNTVTLYRVSDKSMIETMTYTHNDATFTLTKIEGQSDCDNTTPGKYGFKIANKKMTIKLIKDDCSDRSSVIDSTEWSAWKEPRL